MSLDTRVWAGVDGVMPKEWVDSTHTLEGLDGEEGAGRWLRDTQGPMEVAEVASPPLPPQEPIHVCSPAPLRPQVLQRAPGTDMLCLRPCCGDS